MKTYRNVRRKAHDSTECEIIRINILIHGTNNVLTCMYISFLAMLTPSSWTFLIDTKRLPLGTFHSATVPQLCVRVMKLRQKVLDEPHPLQILDLDRLEVLEIGSTRLRLLGDSFSGNVLLCF